MVANPFQKGRPAAVAVPNPQRLRVPVYTRSGAPSPPSTNNALYNYYVANLPTNLKCFIKGNDVGSPLKDATVNAQDFPVTGSGTAYQVSGQFTDGGVAVRFNGSSQAICATNPYGGGTPGNVAMPAAWTLQVKIRMKGVTSGVTFASVVRSTNSQPFIKIGTDDGTYASAGDLLFRFRTDGSAEEVIKTAGALTDDTEFLLTITHDNALGDGKRTKCYKNATEVASDNTSLSTCTLDAASLGCWYLGGSISQNATAVESSAAFLDVALTAAQVSAAYGASSGDVTRPTVLAATVSNAARTQIVFQADEALTLTVGTGLTISEDGGSPRSVAITSVVGSLFIASGISPAIGARAVVTASYDSTAGTLTDGAANKVNDFTNFSVTNRRWRSFKGWQLPIKPTLPYDVDLDTLWLIAQANGKKKVYVNIGGSDSNSGLTGVLAKQTIAAAKTLMVAGDWLAFKSGDTFTETISVYPIDGASAALPSVVTVYGGTAPVYFSPPSAVLTGPVFDKGGGSGPSSNVLIDSVSAYNKFADPDNAAYIGAPISPFISHNNPHTNLLIQNVKATFYDDNSIESFSTPVTSVTVRRCYFGRNWHPSQHSQGLYCASISGLLIEHCIFDHNGWNEAGVDGGVETVFNHTLYLSASGNGNSSVTVRGCISSRASSHGLQARNGAVVFGNLLINNACAMFNGNGAGETAWQPAYTVSNVIVGGKAIAGDPRTQQIEIKASPEQHCVDNIVKDWTGSATNAFMIHLTDTLPAGTTTYVLKLTGNICYNFNGDGLLIDTLATPSMDIQHNDFDTAAGRFCAYYNITTNNSGIRFANNNYFNDGGGFKALVNGANTTVFATWTAAVNEAATGTNFSNTYFAPTRDHLSYNSDATMNAFIASATAFDGGTANPTYYIHAIVNYIRAGFSLPAINAYLAEPLTLVLSSNGGHPVVTWTDDGMHRTGWTIYRSSDGVNFGAPTNVADGVNTYTDSGVTGSTYSYRVAPYDAVGEGAWLEVAPVPVVASGTSAQFMLTTLEDFI